MGGECNAWYPVRHVSCLLGSGNIFEGMEGVLVLLNKGTGGAQNSPSSCRRRCMLSIIGKMMESMLWSRLKKAIKDGRGLSEEQHGFRERHSTIEEKVECYANHQDVLLLTLDVKIAFNSARLDVMLQSLERDF